MNKLKLHMKAIIKKGDIFQKPAGTRVKVTKVEELGFHYADLDRKGEVTGSGGWHSWTGTYLLNYVTL